MATKTTGAEFKRFYSDKAIWGESPGAIWHDDDVVTVNGVVQEDLADENFPDGAAVTISDGVVYGVAGEPSFETFFKRWKRAQTTASFPVECDISKLDAVKAAIQAAGGKVLK